MVRLWLELCAIYTHSTIADLRVMMPCLLQTPASQMELLIGMFAKMTDKQVEQMAKLLVSRDTTLC